MISHTYGDGRSDFISGSADIGTYGNGFSFASYEDEKILYFKLKDDTVEISQIGIYPDVDLEFSGLYISQKSDISLHLYMQQNTIFQAII